MGYEAALFRKIKSNCSRGSCVSSFTTWLPKGRHLLTHKPMMKHGDKFSKIFWKTGFFWGDRWSQTLEKEVEEQLDQVLSLVGMCIPWSSMYILLTNFKEHMVRPRWNNSPLPTRKVVLRQHRQSSSMPAQVSGSYP